MKSKITLFLALAAILVLAAGAAWTQTFIPASVTDQTLTAPLANPVPSSFQPRYISGFGLDNSFTVFFEDRDAGNAISYNSTTTGPTGFASVNTATNISDTHFLIKDWPINIGGTDYAYRAWGSVGNNMQHHFYVSNDLTTWTLLSTFTIPNALSFTDARGWVYYGFHDVILLNGTYYAFAESNQSQTMIVRSANGDDVWEAFASVGGRPGWGPLELPAGVSAGWTPSGSFVDLGHDQGYGKIHVDPRDSHFYLAINTAAKPSLSSADLEAAFINPANWTWHDGTTGPAANPILSETSEHDLRECWVIPNTDPDADWVIVYDADFGSADGGKALGYATLTPPPPPPSEVWVDDDWATASPGEIVDGHTFGYDAFATIRDGIDAVAADGTVHVAAGTYTPALTIVINKSLTILGPQAGVDPRPSAGSTRTPGDASTEAIIDGGTVYRIIKIEADDVTIDGLVVRNGTGDLIRQSGSYSGTTVRNTIVHDALDDEGIQLKNCTNGLVECNLVYDVAQDGISITDGSQNSVIRNNEIYNSYSENAAIYVYDSYSMTVEYNYIHDTQAANGVGFYKNYGGTHTIANNLIVHNRWEGGKHCYDEADGSAIWIYKPRVSSTYLVSHNTLDDNTPANSCAQPGNAIYVKKSAGGVVVNVDDNIVTNHNGYGIRTWSGAAVNYSYNDLWQNALGATDGNPVDGGGNISADPLYNPDYTLQDGSPCIGAASDGKDMGVIFPPRFAPMASFVINHAKLDFKKKADDDKVRVKGKLELDLVNGDGVDISDDVSVTVGPLSETITMVEKGKKDEKWEYKRPKHGTGDIKHMTINWKNGKFDIRMDKADLSGLTDPNNVTISVQIGDDVGEETIEMREKKHHWDYKAKASKAGKSIVQSKFSLSQNSPNPFNPATTIKYQLPKESWVSLCIYNIQGQLVRTLVEGKEKPGYKSACWDSRDSGGHYVASGVYFYVLKVDQQLVETKKMTLIR